MAKYKPRTRGYKRSNYNKTNRFVGQKKPRSWGAGAGEVKFVDAEKARTVVADAWVNARLDPTNDCLNGIQQGIAETQRIGRKVRIVGIYVRGAVELQNFEGQSGVAVGRHIVRILLVQDTQTNKAVAGGEKVMATGTDETFAFKNLDNNKRFKILGDKTIQLNYVAAHGATLDWGATGEVKSFAFMKNVNIPVLFVGTTADIASISDNSFHIYMVTGNTTDAFASYRVRVRYTDN